MSSLEQRACNGPAGFQDNDYVSARHDRQLTEPLLSIRSSSSSSSSLVGFVSDSKTTSFADTERTLASSTAYKNDDDDVDDADLGYVVLVDGNSDEGSAASIIDDDEYPLDPRRFVMLAIFSIENLLAGCAWICFAPIDDVVQTKYGGISQSQVNNLSLIFMIVYGPGTALSSWSVTKYGFRETVVVSAFIMGLGALLRWWSVYFIQGDSSSTGDDKNESRLAYNILWTGQALIAVGQIVFQNAPARVASAWFQKTAAIIGCIVNGAMVGMILGEVLPPLFVNRLDILLAGQAIAMVVCAIAAFLFFESEPKLPPTAAEAARRRHQQQVQSLDVDSANEQHCSPTSSVSIWQSVRQLMSNTQYLILLVAIGIQYGVNNALLTLLQPWMARAGFPDDEIAGLFGSVAIVGGAIGTFIATPLLDKTRNYKQAVRLSFFTSFIVMIGVVFAVRPGFPVWVVLGSSFFMGMSQFPIICICLDAAASNTYPIGEELSSAALQMCGQYLGVVFTYGIGDLLQKDGGHADHETPLGDPANMVLLTLMGMGAGVALFYNGQDRRYHRHPTTPATNSNRTSTTTSSDSINLLEENGLP
eukprot:CAMPEP_0178857584 /NCGR_PEP_ID=MMETSP0747-20121128/213_1 /TAXON_ID=913974 /ORGANISM="Nitzschia punctata, Strain CCMP561" /LENGTH=588 /DNA_ID=CAMNT_0020523831 /DNA_START=54 /DNA_END=1820 /DNA_ORIENTATION=-